eukprot:1191088-Prorocentrum_minimum.AAC.1
MSNTTVHLPVGAESALSWRTCASRGAALAELALSRRTRGLVQAACVSIQFPDPHFKKRHHKRRIVQPGLVDAVADVLSPGRKVFLQSDVREVAVAMREQFEKYSRGR